MDPKRSNAEAPAPSLGPRRPTTAFLAAVALLAIGLVPFPGDTARAVRLSLRTPEVNRVGGDAAAAGYYEGLIGGDGDAGRAELALRLLGKPTDWVHFRDIDAVDFISADPLQFELKPSIRRELFGRTFTTNALGLRDRETTRSKPPGTVRVALLGSSMDMGWGVGTGETYENLLEDRLNARAGRAGDPRRFEVLNFAVAAYCPLQRVESLRRKAVEFEPDVVLYSATLLDGRLLEIHLTDLLERRVEPTSPAVRRLIAAAGLTAGDLKLDPQGRLVSRAAVKVKLQPVLASILDAALGDLAAECRARNLPVVMAIIPRVSDAEDPEARNVAVARLAAAAARHAIPVIDLTAVFDDEEPAKIEIAAWDDHPNARGHRLLFQALAEHLDAEPGAACLRPRSEAVAARRTEDRRR